MSLLAPKQFRQFVEAVQDIVGAMLVGAGIVTVTYNDAGGLATISGTGGGGSTNVDGGNASSIPASNIDGGTAAG